MSDSDLASSAAHLRTMPGHAIRRLQQISVALFMQEIFPLGLTPVQFAVLQALEIHPMVEQKTLAKIVSLDTSTIGAVIDRLESRQLLTRSQSPQDRRVRLLHLTPAGAAQLKEAMPSVLRTQERILEPLTDDERTVFAEMMQKLCDGRHVKDV